MSISAGLTINSLESFANSSNTSSFHQSNVSGNVVNNLMYQNNNIQQQIYIGDQATFSQYTTTESKENNHKKNQNKTNLSSNKKKTNYPVDKKKKGFFKSIA